MSVPWITGPSNAPTRAIVALLIAAFGMALALTLMFLGMRSVMDVGGACAEGGAYAIRQTCPEGSALAMFVGIFGLFGFGALGMWAGSVVGSGWVALPLLAWPALFGSLGFNFLQYAFDPPPGGDTSPVWGWLIPGVLFEAMALVPLVVGIGWLRESQRTRRPASPRARSASIAQPSSTMRDLRGRLASDLAMRATSAAGAPAATDPSSAPDPGDRVGAFEPGLVEGLERLAALHRAGSLSDAEFDDAKRTLIRNAGGRP